MRWKISQRKKARYARFRRQIEMSSLYAPCVRHDANANAFSLRSHEVRSRVCSTRQPTPLTTPLTTLPWPLATERTTQHSPPRITTVATTLLSPNVRSFGTARSQTYPTEKTPDGRAASPTRTRVAAIG